MMKVFFLLFITFGQTAPTKWIHPGVLVDGPRLNYINSQLNNDPFKTAYQKALVSYYANKNWVPKGPPSTGVIECGQPDPDNGCTAENDDGAAAYLQILLFNLTKETVYANNVIKILNSYGYNLKKYNNSNGPLQAAWAASKWTRAAELASWLPGVNWPIADQNVFKNMLLTVNLPMIYPGSGSNGNWELSMIEGMIGMSVLLENATLFDHAVNFWYQRVPAYFYNTEFDGNQPVPAPRGNPGWYGQTVYNTSTNGHCQETCRDEGHVSMGQAAMMNAAETAYIQGLDLFGWEPTRLIGSVEYNTYWNVGNKPPQYVCNGTIALSTAHPTYEIAYNAFVNRRNFSLPNTYQYILTKVRTNPDPMTNLMEIYETLTHGGSPK